MQPRLFTFDITKRFTAAFSRKPNFFFNTTVILSYTKGMLPLCLISGSVYIIPGSGTVSSLCRDRRRSFALPRRGEAISKMLELWPEWSLVGRSAGCRRRTLATAGLWFRVRRWTHVAGSQMAPHPSRETRGQRAVTSIQPADPTPWPLERSASLMYFGHWDVSNSCMCHIYTMTVDRDKSKDAFFNVCKTRGQLAQANPFFDASGEEAGSPLYCWEMDGSCTCRGLLLAPRQSYQLRLNLSFWLL